MPGEVKFRVGGDDDNSLRPSTIIENEVPPLQYQKNDKTSKEKIDSERVKGQESPEQNANFLSMLTFWWLGPLMLKGYKNPLEQSDLPPLTDVDDAKFVATKFAKVWEEEQKKIKPDLTRALFRCFRTRLWWGAALQLTTVLLQLTPSIFLNSLLIYIQGPPEGNFMYRIFGEHYGYFAALALLVVPTINTLVNNQFYQHMFRLGVHVKTALVEVVYHKSLRLSNSARQGKSVGEIVTLMQVDTEKVSMTTTFLHVTWSGLLQVFFNLILLYYFIGWSALTGFALLLVTIPTQGWLVSLLLKMQKRILLNTGRRVKVINEVLQGIRVVKSYAWENPFKKSITDVRAKELAAMSRRVYIRAMQSCLMLATPILIMLVTFAFYAGVAHKPMTASVVFTAVSLFNSLRIPLMFYPFVINAVLAGHVSLVRLGKFLGSEELKSNTVERREPGDEGESSEIVLEVKNSSFRWSVPPPSEDNKDKRTKPGGGPPKLGDSESKAGSKKGDKKEKKSKWWQRKKQQEAKEEKPASKDDKDVKLFSLSDVNFTAKRGSLVAVVGPVGSGKSSLVCAVLGEMDVTAGEGASIRASVAYCSQQAWIMNSSLRDNILFGREYDEELYQKVIHVCALTQDLAALPDGDLTEIGERGINLSGGQKQRVSLARAVYCDAELYILDDPLSAVDAHVGQHIFQHCILGALKAKTRVFVTNQLQYVPSADHIVVLKDGRIAETGTYQECMSVQGEFAALMKDSGSHDDNANKEGAAQPTLKPSISKAFSVKGLAVVAKEKKKFSKEGTLVLQEDRARGMLKLEVYWKYWTESSRLIPLGVLVLYCVVQVVDAYQRYWLAYWTADQYHTSTGVYLAAYAGLAALFTVLVYFRTLFQALLGLWTSKFLHEGMLNSIMRCPMSFFDTTPVGRILNRFSADQAAVDETLPFSWSAFLNILFQVFASIIVICIVTPYWTLVFIPVAVVYFFMQQVYRRTARELKRLDSVSKSPVYQQFTETLNGLSTIRAYQQQERFLRMCDDKLDANNRANFLLRCCDRWLSVRLETMGNVMVSAAAVFAASQKGTLYAGFAGISIDYALQITASLSMLVRNMTDTENQMNGVERMLEYRDRQEHEAAGVNPDNHPADDWPAEGSIVMEDIAMRYRPSLPLVLKGVSFTVQAGQKVGVVGRTGSGKSSLMLVLFRLVEPSAGRVLIDGMDTAALGLEDLRSRLSIIPQDPVLFSGSVRSNLDPFQHYSDADIWLALERAHLKEKVAGLAGKLDSDVAEYGENFSVGERQLLCLARVLLRKSRILVMDEATSSVDYDTDRLIQGTIRSHLQDTTMLIIAHRINTVIDASAILVLHDGEVAEYDTPANLLDLPGGKFASLVADTGEKSSAHLRKVARGESDFFSVFAAAKSSSDDESSRPLDEKSSASSQ